VARHTEPITRLASGRYRLRVDAGTHHDGRRRQITRTFNTRREAQQALSEIRVAARSGSFIGRSQVTLEEQYDSWLLGKRNLRPSTVQHYRDVAKPLLAQYGDVPVQNLTKAALERLVSDLLTTGGVQGRGRSVSFVRTLVIGLSQALDLAVEEGICRTNVARLIHLPQMPLVEPLTWTSQEADTFLTHITGDRLEACWRLTMAGLRRGEVMGLDWEHIDFAAGTFTIDTTRVDVHGTVIASLPKTRRGWRILPIWPELDTALKTLKRTQAEERLAIGGYASNLLATYEDGTPITPRTYADWFKRLAKAAGLPPIPLKNARHTSVTRMRNQGIQDHIVAAWHGHDETVMRAVYTDAQIAQMRAAAEAL